MLIKSLNKQIYFRKWHSSVGAPRHCRAPQGPFRGGQAFSVGRCVGRRGPGSLPPTGLAGHRARQPGRTCSQGDDGPQPSPNKAAPLRTQGCPVFPHLQYVPPPPPAHLHVLSMHSPPAIYSYARRFRVYLARQMLAPIPQQAHDRPFQKPISIGWHASALPTSIPPVCPASGELFSAP